MKHIRLLTRVLALAVVAAVFCVPLFHGLKSVDQENDEAIYSYAAQSLLETGDWMNPRSSPTPELVFLEKPPLKFWIVALPIRLGLLPDDDFGLRFWDPVLGGLAFLYVFAYGRRLAGWACGATAVLTLYTFSDLLFLHGVRGNNMEAAVVLAYAGGIYHYLRWTECQRPGMARAHASAVGVYFLLAFMTKFVAAAFLPVIVLAASVEVPAARSRLIREWRTWVAVAAGVVLLAAPWFVYQSFRPGPGIWSVMFGEHVVKRFQSSLDPAHLHPWYFYFQYLARVLVGSGTVWAVALGAVLLHARALGERWLAGTLVLYWFWLPFIVISGGSSKLSHYAYPFLLPVAIAAGYALAAIANAVSRGIAAMHDPAWAERLPWPAVARLRARVRPASLGARRVLIAAAAVSLALGAIGLLHPGRVHVFDVTLRTPDPIRSALTALLLGILAGQGARMARLAVPLILLTLMPVQEYANVIRRTELERHPQRSTSECMARVRAEEQAAGRPVRGMWVYLPRDSYSHSLFFYYREFGWNPRPELTATDLVQTLDDPSQQRPLLVAADYWTAFHATRDARGTIRPSVAATDHATLLLPGPYGRCSMLGLADDPAATPAAAAPEKGQAR